MTATRLGDYLAADVDRIEASHPAKHAQRRMDTEEKRSLIAVEGDRVVGIIQRNALLKLSHDELEQPVSAFMLTDYPYINEGHSVESAAQSVGHDVNIEQIPVVSETGELAGAVYRAEIVRGAGEATGGKVGREVHAGDDQFAASGSGDTGESHVVQGERAPVHEGMDVKSASGSKLGSLVQATFKTDGNVEFFVMEHGLIFKKQKHLPGDLIDRIEGDTIHLRIDKQEFDVLEDIGEE